MTGVIYLFFGIARLNSQIVESIFGVGVKWIEIFLWETIFRFLGIFVGFQNCPLSIGANVTRSILVTLCYY
jgi:hypothetical protein